MEETVDSRRWKDVRGSTSINHKLRLKYNLSYPEYVILDFIQMWFEKHKGKAIDADVMFRNTGYDLFVNEFHSIIKLLIEKRLVVLVTIPDELILPQPTDTWLANFDLTADFDEFWTGFGKIGNKEKAKAMYMKARKVVDKETLHQAMQKYIANLGETYPLHASTYLNPKNKHWEDVIVEKKKPVTRQDTQGQFNEGTF